MTRLTKEKGSLTQDDRLDCVAIGVAYWVDQMNADAEKQMEARRADLLDQELRVWHNDLTPGSWFDLACIAGIDSLSSTTKILPGNKSRQGSCRAVSGWLKM
jgi:hypothetical protein